MTDPQFGIHPDSVNQLSWRHISEAERLEARIVEEPTDLNLLLSLARARMIEGNFLRASLVADDIIANWPDLAEPHAIRALALAHIDPRESNRSADCAAMLGSPLATDEPTLAPSIDETITIWIDLTDLIEYLTVNVTLSGIQRVVANLIRVAGSHGPYRRMIRAVIPDFATRTLLTIPIDLAIELVDAVEIHHAGRVHLDRILFRIRSSLAFVEAAPGDVFLMPGAFWISHNYDLLKDLRVSGVLVSLFIHDLIQINNPQYVEPAATDVFRRSLIDVLELASFVMTNSEFVAVEVRRFLRTQLQLTCPVSSIPLATEMNDDDRASSAELVSGQQFGQHGYVLCVCTIEIRKNHRYLTDIWEQLVARGRTDLPTLVFVGKWGWQIESFRQYLAQTHNLNGIVRVMVGVSDQLLASLYKEALFTIYPSFAEGWGLPVGESLVFGTPCLASGVTSIPEVGGALVRYFDPLDMDSGVRAVATLLDDRDDLSQWAERVRSEFAPRTWRDFSFNLIETTRLFAASMQGDEPKPFARLFPGEMAIIGGDDVTAAAGQRRTMRTGRMARGEGWHHVEFDGVWMKAPRATLRFTAGDCQPGDLIDVTLALAGTNHPLACAISTTEGMSNDVSISTVGVHRLSHCARIGPDGSVDLTLLARGSAVRFADRDNYARLTGFGFIRRANAEDRIRIMEAIVLQ